MFGKTGITFSGAFGQTGITFSGAFGQTGITFSGAFGQTGITFFWRFINKVALFHNHFCDGFDMWYKRLYVNERT